MDHISGSQNNGYVFEPWKCNFFAKWNISDKKAFENRIIAKNPKSYKL